MRVAIIRHGKVDFHWGKWSTSKLGVQGLMKKIEKYEPLIFLFFGIFHLYRIWGLID